MVVLIFSRNKLYIDIKISIIYCLSPVDKHHRYVVIFALHIFNTENWRKSGRFHSMHMQSLSSFRCFGNNVNNKKKASWTWQWFGLSASIGQLSLLSRAFIPVSNKIYGTPIACELWITGLWETNKIVWLEWIPLRLSWAIRNNAMCYFPAILWRRSEWMPKWWNNDLGSS
jgi:hypothetical protein